MAAAVGLGVPFDTTTVLHAKNAHDLENIAACALELGANSVRFAMMQPTGTPLDAEFFMKPEAWRDVLRRIHDLAGRGLNVTTADGWPVERDSGACTPLQNGIVHVGANGRVSLCCNLSGAPRKDGKLDSAEVAAPGAAEAIAGLDDVAAKTRNALKESREQERPWRDFECNSCARHHGRPFWQDDGAAGPTAARARWTKRPHRLPLLPS
jgi:MoaA/NifB/PqqE/SkfB family radical SAM enzyme